MTIVIEQLTQIAPGATTSITVDHSIISPNSVLILLWVETAGNTQTSATFNGVSLQKLVSSATNASASIWWMTNPPIGTYPVVISGSNDNHCLVALSVTGLNIGQNPLSASLAFTASSNVFLSLTPPSANSLIIDLLSTQSSISSANVTNQYQNILIKNGVAGNLAASYSIVPGGQNQSIGWTPANQTGDYVAVVFEPIQAPNLWFPTVGLQSLDSIIKAHGLDQKNSLAMLSVGYKPTTFFQDSFLHTVGRSISPVPAVAAGGGNDWPIMTGKSFWGWRYSG